HRCQRRHQHQRALDVFVDLLQQALANHHALAVLRSAPEVRVLPSTGVTRPQQYYDPVRHPQTPPPVSDVEAATLMPSGAPLRANEGETSSPREFRLEGAEG